MLEILVLDVAYILFLFVSPLPSSGVQQSEVVRGRQIAAVSVRAPLQDKDYLRWFLERPQLDRLKE